MVRKAAVGPAVGLGWPRAPLLTGHVYQITDPLTFFSPILNGQGPPQQGFKPWSGLEVRTWSVNDLFPIPFPGGTAFTQTDGSFGINQTPPNPVLGVGGLESDVRFSLVVTEGSFPFRPLYRSDLSLTVAAAETTELNIWLLPETIDVADGVSAGSVSSVLKGSGLPDNTEITASPSGLAFSGGTGSGVAIRFAIAITPDTSFNLNTVLDLTLTSAQIYVGWPADWCTNAEDVFKQISEGLQRTGAKMNASVLTELEADIANQTGLPLSLIQELATSAVSVTLMDVNYPAPYTWDLSNTTDPTVVITGDVCIGYPRSLSSDPSTVPVRFARRLSRLLRPVLI